MTGCLTISDVTERYKEALRVGITPDYAPLIFKQGYTVTGVGADLARELAAALGRRVEFVDLKWEQQIPALLDRRTDIIMSGMSVTKPRQLRIHFTESYLKNGLMALMRKEDRNRYTSPERILNSAGVIGVQKGTTGDIFVQENCTRARRLAIATPQDAVFHLRNKRIDLFIHDGHSIRLARLRK